MVGDDPVARGDEESALRAGHQLDKARAPRVALLDVAARLDGGDELLLDGRDVPLLVEAFVVGLATAPRADEDALVILNLHPWLRVGALNL